MAMIIKCINATPSIKVALAKQAMSCVIDEIEKEPNPMLRKLN